MTLRNTGLAVLVLAGAVGGMSGAEAQDPDPEPPDSLPVDSALVDPGPVEPVRPATPVPTVQPSDSGPDRPTPLGAMVRSFVLPGWGQAAFDAHFRGGIYFSGWVGNWYMNFRNAYRLGSARERFELRTDQIEAELIASSGNPDSMRAQIDSFPSILTSAVRADSLGNDLRKLVDSREQQREDWIAWSAFWLLASGIDAYVNAHLADFPAEIELRGGRQGELSLRVGIPWPGPHRRARPPPGDARIAPGGVGTGGR